MEGDRGGERPGSSHALTAARRDVIILDLMMPTMDGFGFSTNCADGPTGMTSRLRS
jgi:CheY-like chemotaxis protein